MQVVDANGNVFGQGLEITGIDGKPKVPVINTDITIGTTAIIGGAVGRILFEGNGNVVQESSSFTYDDALKRFTLTGPIGSVIQHTALTNYNDFGGFQLNVAGGAERAFMKLQPNSGEFKLGVTGSGYFTTFHTSGLERARIFQNGNFAVNTTTDSGFKFDVAGTIRSQSSLFISNPSFTMGGSITHSANATLVITGGPGAGGENITFGPSNRIFINAQQTRFPSGSVQMASTLTVGSTNATSTNMFLMQGSITAGSGLGRGIGMDTTLIASANNDVLVGLDVKPTYTLGAFTGVTTVDLRTNGANVTIGSSYGYGALYGYANDGLVQIKTAATYKTQMWFRPSGNAGGYNASYWSRIEHDGGTLNIIGSSYGQLSIVSSNGTGNGAKIYFSGATGAANNALSLDGPANSGRIALTTYGSSPITINGGNFLVNTTTDAGFRADINGTLRATGVITGYQFNSSYNGGSYSSIGVNVLDYGDGLRIGYSSSVQKITLFTAAGTARFQVVNSGSILIGTTTEITSSLLTLTSSTRGFLPPRMSNTEMLAIVTPAPGLQVYDTTNNKMCVYDGTTWQNLY